MPKIPLSPRTITVGVNQLLLTDEDFLSGSQAGHLAYMVQDRARQFSDTGVRKFLMAKLENMDFPEAWCFGYVVGWLVTFAGKPPGRQATTLRQEEP
jgi:hypothetical protein